MHSREFPKQSAAFTRAAGHFCVTVLRVLRWLPVDFSYSALKLFLPIYPFLRIRRANRLQNILQKFWKSTPFQSTASIQQNSLKKYYQTRLKLLLLNLHVHGRAVNHRNVHVTRKENYNLALTQNRPILLLGLHQGVLEYLHKIPAKPANRPFYILTAPAFAPSLSQFMASGRSLDGKQIIWDRNLSVTDSAQEKEKSGLSFSNGIREIIKHKGVLAMMADQIRTTGNELLKIGEAENTIRLFNMIEIPSSIQLLKYLVEKDFLILPVSTFLMSDGISKFTFNPAWNLTEIKNTENLESEIRSKLKIFLEAAISSAPEQWNWSYPKNRLVNDC